MEPFDTAAAEIKAKRRAPKKSVIEATDASPMPIVETAAEPAVPTPFVAAAPATPPAAVPADPVSKDAPMDTTTQTVEMTNKAQAMFADMNERTKGAVEKTTKLVEELAAFNKGNIEALVESSKIAARGFESIGQDVATFAKQSFEQSTAAMKTLATVKSPTEFMKLQSDLVRQSFDQMVAQTSRQTETMLKLAGEIAQPLSNRVAVAAEKMKIAA